MLGTVLSMGAQLEVRIDMIPVLKDQRKLLQIFSHMNHFQRQTQMYLQLNFISLHCISISPKSFPFVLGNP